MRGEFHIETLRADFLTDKLAVYQDVTALYMQTQQLVPAFQTVERAKARLLCERLTFRLSQEAATLSFSEDSELQMLNERLQATLTQLEMLYPKTTIEGMQEVSELGTVPKIDTATKIANLEKEAQTCIHQIQRTQPLFSVYATGEPAPFAQICHNLVDHVLVQFHLGHDKVWAFWVTQEGIGEHIALAALADVEAARQGMTAAIERTLELIHRFGMERSLRYLQTVTQEIQASLLRRYQLLFQPLLRSLPPSLPLIIVPDQTLNYIPFHALFDGQSYLLETRTLSYSPSATVLNLCLNQHTSGDNVMLCGYDNAHLSAVVSLFYQNLPAGNTRTEYPYYIADGKGLGAHRSDILTVTVDFAGETVAYPFRAWPADVGSSKGEQEVSLVLTEEGEWTLLFTGGYTRTLTIEGATLWAGGIDGLVMVDMATNTITRQTLPWDWHSDIDGPLCTTAEPAPCPPISCALGSIPLACVSKTMKGFGLRL